MKDQSQLLLQNQLCFPVYAMSRMITRLYQPLLDAIDLTYPQYLVMLVLWEEDSQKISKIGTRLYLNTNTLTPLLRKLENKGLITKHRQKSDERTILVCLSAKGITLQNKASSIPQQLADESNIPIEELDKMRATMWKMLNFLEK